MTAVVATLVFSLLLCGAYLRFARARQFLDIPGERSSHSQPTPHGGGLALVSAFILGMLLAAQLYGAWNTDFLTLSVIALALMLLGAIDDLRGLSVPLRLVLYTLACLWVVHTLLPATDTGNALRSAALLVVVTLALLWTVNLYNFMDGIDGIAALQTVLTCGCAAWLSWRTGHGGHYALFCLLLAAAHAGFLFWNYPPARLFMGDAGSVPSGFLLASLALLGAVQGHLNPLCWVVLLGVFITDTTWTLLWRLGTGQAFMQPHRSHAYQRLSRHWDSHRKVDMLLLAINALWLFPLAWAVQLWPGSALILVFLAYLPLLYGMAKIGRFA